MCDYLNVFVLYLSAQLLRDVGTLKKLEVLQLDTAHVVFVDFGGLLPLFLLNSLHQLVRESFDHACGKY